MSTDSDRITIDNAFQKTDQYIERTFEALSAEFLVLRESLRIRDEELAEIKAQHMGFYDENQRLKRLLGEKTLLESGNAVDRPV